MVKKRLYSLRRKGRNGNFEEIWSEMTIRGREIGVGEHL